MIFQQVFISYDSTDREIVEKVAASLARIGIQPLLAEDVIQAGIEIPKKIATGIAESNCFVAILTERSKVSQWLNQEIGYVYALTPPYALQPNILIVPFRETGLQVKGFLQAHEHISFDRRSPDEGIYRLLKRLRGYINRNWPVLKELAVACKQCRLPFKIPLLSQDEIDRRVHVQKNFSVECQNPNCRTMNNLNPRTLEVIADG